MTVFTSLEAALRYGFAPLEWRPHEKLWVVRATITRGDQKAFALAWARPKTTD